MPDMSHAAVRLRLLKHYSHVIDELQQIIRDLEYWNNNRTEHAPFDIESSRIALSAAKKIHAIVEADNGPIPDELVEQLTNALQEEI